MYVYTYMHVYIYIYICPSLGRARRARAVSSQEAILQAYVTSAVLE